MTTTTAATPAGPILALDLGKYKCVACASDRATAAAAFHTIDTSRAELDSLVRRARPAVVVIEASLDAGRTDGRRGVSRLLGRHGFAPPEVPEPE